MLIQFNFKNFKSFREYATLDLSAAKMTEFSERVVSIGSEKILPVAAIYGANASGKSNIYNAFEYMTKYVVDSFKLLIFLIGCLITVFHFSGATFLASDK